MKSFARVCVAAVALTALTSHALVIDLTGNGGNLGPQATFAGPAGFELTVGAFATANPTNPSQPFVTDSIRQNNRGLGTNIGANGLGNGNPSFFAQILSFGVNRGKITGVEIWGFGRNEDLNVFAAETLAPPPPTGPFEFVDTLQGAPGNPVFFALPDFNGPYLQFISSLADRPTNVRIHAIHVPEPGVLAGLLLGLALFGARKRLAR